MRLGHPSVKQLIYGIPGVPKLNGARKRGLVPQTVDRLVSHKVAIGSSLLISGYWRSGTTWLLQCIAAVINAKTVYEPLNFSFAPIPEAMEGHNRTHAREASLSGLYMPYCGAATIDAHPLNQVFLHALRGTSPGRWVRRVRTGFADSLRTRVVVKVVKGHLCLGAAQRTFLMPVLHVHRDPRSIIASLMAADWLGWFSKPCLQMHFLGLSDGRAAYFERWHDEIAEYDSGDVLTRAVAYWALVERFLADSVEGSTAPFLTLRYEDILLEPERTILGALESLGVDHPGEVGAGVFRRDSVTTKQRGATRSQRLRGWESSLSGAEVARIESVSQALGVAHRLLQAEQPV